jgi:PTS system nitrogen regulatory IIA component
MIQGPIVGIDAIIPELRGRETAAVFAELCEPLARSTGVPLAELVASLEEREALASTAVGDGVAMPHGVHAGSHRVAASFGRSREGLPFDAVNAHLKALARWSRILVSSEVRRALLDAPDADAILRILNDASS